MAHWRGALHGEREREVDLDVGLEGCGTRNRHATSTHPAGKIASLAHTPPSSLSQRSIPPLPIPYSTLMSEPCSLLRLHICAAHTHTRRLLGRRPRRPFLPSLSALSLSAATRRNCAGTASIIREGPKWAAAGRRLRSRARAAAYSWTIETRTRGRIILLGSESLPSFLQYHLSFICHFLVHLTDTAPDFGNHEHMRQSLERWPRPLPLLNWP